MSVATLVTAFAVTYLATLFTPALTTSVMGRASRKPDTALRLARVTRMSAAFWLGLQVDWDLWHTLHSGEAKAIAKLAPLPRAS